MKGMDHEMDGLDMVLAFSRTQLLSMLLLVALLDGSRKVTLVLKRKGGWDIGRNAIDSWR